MKFMTVNKLLNQCGETKFMFAMICAYDYHMIESLLNCTYCRKLLFFFTLLIMIYHMQHMSHHMGKPTICICENEDTDQLRGNREADQRLCFR